MHVVPTYTFGYRSSQITQALPFLHAHIKVVSFTNIFTFFIRVILSSMKTQPRLETFQSSQSPRRHLMMTTVTKDPNQSTSDGRWISVELLMVALTPLPNDF